MSTEEVDLNKYLTVRDLLDDMPYAVDTRNKFKTLLTRIEIKPAKIITAKSISKDKVEGRTHNVKLNCYSLTKTKKYLEKYIASFTYTTGASAKEFAIKVLEIVNKKLEEIENNV